MKNGMTLVAAFFMVLASGCAEHSEALTRPPAWAEPIPLEGVPNLHKVSDDLYRSGQPTAEGMKNLEGLGIETILNLRSFHSDRDEIENTDLRYEHLYMKAWHPERKEVVRFLRLVTNPECTPLLVHCQHGADRTGTLCALYRVVIQGWSKEEAIEEMIRGDFGFHEIWKNLPAWIEALDMEGIRKEAGIESRGIPWKPEEKETSPEAGDQRGFPAEICRSAHEGARDGL